MPGENCAVYGCSASRSQNHKGIPIFKVPGGSDEFNTKWRKDIVGIILKTRTMDRALKGRIESNKLYDCARHFKEDQILQHMFFKFFVCIMFVLYYGSINRKFGSIYKIDF